MNLGQKVYHFAITINVTVQPHHSQSRTSCSKACLRKRIAHDPVLSPCLTLCAHSCKYDSPIISGMAELLPIN